MSAQFIRLVEEERPPITLTVDGTPVAALAGDTVMVAVLLAGRRLRLLEPSGQPCAGFCLMGACQDCWMWRDDGGRIRACTTYVEDGMAVLTTAPDGRWPKTA